MTVASTSHFAQIARNASTSAGLDDRHHPLLRLAHQDLLRRERGVAQRHPVELDVHAAVAGGGQLGGGAGQAGAAEVLDAGDQPGREQLEGALDEQLLHERVADLDAGPLGRAVAPSKVSDGQHRDAADAVAAGAWRRTGSPGCRRPVALARCRSSCRSTPTQSALTSGLPR